jgi:hypothetical protein
VYRTLGPVIDLWILWRRSGVDREPQRIGLGAPSHGDLVFAPPHGRLRKPFERLGLAQPIA